MFKYNWRWRLYLVVDFSRDFFTLRFWLTRHVLHRFVGLARFDLSLMKWESSNSLKHLLHRFKPGGEGGRSVLLFLRFLFGGGSGARWDGIFQIMRHTGLVVMAAFTSL